MNMHVNRPETGAQTIPSALLTQERDRLKALRRVAKLRKQAAAEIERLIAFLDASDDYATTELEDAVDETGCDEDMDREPSLGSSNAVSQMNWGDAGTGAIDAEDEHDGGEPENEHGDRADYEPSLGWTTDGVIGNCTETGCDVELQNHLPVTPQGRTVIPGAGAVMVDNSYRRFLHGLTPDQTAALKARMSNGNRVVLR